MKDDQTKWNAKYSQARDQQSVCAFVQHHCTLAPSGGTALDLAAGLGANALFLAEQGFHVDAVDISDVAMKRLEGRHPRVAAICADLDYYEVPANGYDLIVTVHYLNRRLFPQIREGLRPGGVFIAETFLEGDPDGAQQPTCRDYLLRPNELLHAFLSLHILLYEEKPNDPPIRASHLAYLVAQKPKL